MTKTESAIAEVDVAAVADDGPVRYQRRICSMALKDILPGRLGFGAAPLGNMFRDIPEQEALATVNAAWDDGIRYFDTAPFYGAGLAEIRMGAALAGRPRSDYVVSTKVGRLILDEVEDVSARDLGEKGGVFKHGRPNRIVNDYSRDGTLRFDRGQPEAAGHRPYRYRLRA